MNDFIVGMDKDAIKKYRGNYKYIRIPLIWMILGLQLRYLPEIMQLTGRDSHYFWKAELIGNIILTVLPLILYLVLYYYTAPWGVFSIGEECISYKTRVMGFKDVSIKEQIDYELVRGTRFDSKRSVMTLRLEESSLEFVVEEDVAKIIDEKIEEKREIVRYR